MQGFRMFRLVAALAAAAALGSATYALTGSNSVAATAAGSGSGAISGYAVSEISYSLDGANPANIASVSFTISPATATTVKARLGSTWYDCANSAGSVSCTTTGAAVASADSLTVVALQ